MVVYLEWVVSVAFKTIFTVYCELVEYKYKLCPTK